MKRMISLLVAVVFLLGITVGCQSTPKPAASADSTKQENTQKVAETTKEVKKAVTLKFLCDNENYQDRLKNFIENYKKSSGNDVEAQLFPATEYDNIIKTKMMAGEGPDIYRTDDVLGAQYAWPLDWPLDLSTRPWVSRISDTGLKLLKWNDGRITGLTITNPSGFGIMYNKDIFTKVGITDVPKTWTEFLAVCDKIKKAGIIPVDIQLANGSEFGTTHLMHQLFANVAVTHKNDMADFMNQLSTNKLKLAQVPEFKKALDQMYELKQKGYINEDFISNTFEMAQEKIGTGKVAMHPCGDFILTPLLANYPDLKVGFFPAPFGDTEGMIGLYSGVGMSVNAKSKNLDAATGFIDFFASKEQQELYMETSPGTTVFTDVNAKTNMISEDLDKYSKAGKAALCFFATFQPWPEMECRKMMQEFMLGNMDSNQMLAELDKKTEIIAKGKKLQGW